MTVSSGDALAIVEDAVANNEFNTQETITEVAVDNSETIAQLETLNSNVYLILHIVLAALVWTVIRYLYKFFSMFFSF